MIEAIIFDFDGVIVDSNKVKRESYFETFSGIRGSERFVEQAIRENLQKTRYGVIEAILKKLKKEDLMTLNTPEDLSAETSKYVLRYSEMSENKTINADEIKGANNAIQELSQTYPLFILTSTVQKSIDRIVKYRELKDFFKGVYGANGSSYDKSQALKKIAETYEFNPRNAVFVGDGKADYECARCHCIHFVAIVNETNDFRFIKYIKHKLKDLTKLTEVVRRIEEEIKND